MNLSIEEIIDSSNLIIADIKSSKKTKELQLIDKRIEVFKDCYYHKAKYNIDIELVDTYYNLLNELLDYARMQLTFKKEIS